MMIEIKKLIIPFTIAIEVITIAGIILLSAVVVFNILGKAD